METTAESLYKRVDELIESHKQPIYSTTGTHSAIGELMARNMGLEEAIRELALAFQRFEDSHEGPSADSGSAAGRETFVIAAQMRPQRQDCDESRRPTRRTSS